MSVTSVDLGFIEKDFDSWELESRHFPSKVGGKPAWLDLATLPKSDQLKCPTCNQPRRFLLQVYSPDANQENAFHRSLFVFVCVNSSCWSGTDSPLIILRSQLPRSNQFYPIEPPEDNEDWRKDITASAHGALCPVCGCRGDKTCGRCRSVSYCSESHQKIHWKKGGHKAMCLAEGDQQKLINNPPDTGFLLEEALIVREPEPGKTENVTNEDFEKYKHLIDGGGVDAGPEELEEIEAGQKEDVVYSHFRKQVGRASDQILRYEREGKPLICAAKPPLNEPSNCEQCGAKRAFEMQIMPQLLSELHLGIDATQDGIDWGSVYIYTCSKSCDIIGYACEEFQLRNFEMSNLPTT